MPEQYKKVILMQLKEFQDLCLKKLDYYLQVLKSEYLEEKEVIKFLRSKGQERQIKEYSEKTWKKLEFEGKLPHFKNTLGKIQPLPYLNKKDGLAHPIPNILLKVPTGGGKTLIAVFAVERINFDYFQKTTGLILWIVPTDVIYRQTFLNFKNKSHPYRQILERAGAGRVKILEWRKNKTNSFSVRDLKENLCVMLLMLQSANRETKESLRVFKDSGKFIDFFPKARDGKANEKLISYMGNLDTYIDKNPLGGGTGAFVKHSLGNAIRLAQPIVIMDEGHRAYSDLARKTLSDLNPRFILELSATPNMKSHKSNVLVSISGVKLKEEEMIKLPINITNTGKGDWKKTLCQAYDKLQELQKLSKINYKKTKKYIRPIMLVQVERTGKDQIDTNFVHSEDVKNFLISRLKVREREIKIKVAEKDELKDESLLSHTSPVRFIITKQALQEGWDCPFAYVLAVLSNSRSKQAMTQLIGRILRQPYAQKAEMESLNESYVFCYNRLVQEVVNDIKKGLQKEGMADLTHYITTKETALKKVKVNRRPTFKDTKIFLPRVLCKTQNNVWRNIIYEEDILKNIDFSKISYSEKERLTPENIDSLQVDSIQVDMSDHANQFTLPYATKTRWENQGMKMDYPFMIKRLSLFIPNPWEAVRILDETIDSLKVRKISDEQLYLNRNWILRAMEQDIEKQIDRLSEKLFIKKLKAGDLCFKIFKKKIDINWEMKSDMDFVVSRSDKILRRRDESDFQLSLFDKTYQSHYNELEKQVAWYLDEQSAVKWWHRIAVKQGYHLQGWQKRKIYPDFLAFISSENKVKKLSVLEAKGDHLKGNDDTNYKKKLFKILEKHATNEIMKVGDMEVVSEAEQKMVFQILMENRWREDLQEVIEK